MRIEHTRQVLGDLMKLSVCSSSDQGRWEAAGHCYSVIRLVTLGGVVGAASSRMSVCECFLCGRKFQFGPYEYDGRHIEIWEIDVCRPCIRANYDGIDLDEYPKLKKLLEDKIWLVIPLNSSGLLDIPTD